MFIGVILQKKSNAVEAANTNLFVLILLLLGQWGRQKKSYL